MSPVLDAVVQLSCPTLQRPLFNLGGVVGGKAALDLFVVVVVVVVVVPCLGKKLSVVIYSNPPFPLRIMLSGS